MLYFFQYKSTVSSSPVSEKNSTVKNTILDELNVLILPHGKISSQVLLGW